MCIKYCRSQLGPGPSFLKEKKNFSHFRYPKIYQFNSPTEMRKSSVVFMVNTLVLDFIHVRHDVKKEREQMTILPDLDSFL